MKKLGVLWLVVFISLTGFGITTIPFPLVAEAKGASDFWKTFGGAGVFSLFQLLSTPLWGRCSDAYGRKPILILSSAGMALSFAWLAFATSLESMLLARAFGGVTSGNLAAAFAYTADVTEPEDRAKGLGIVASAFGVGFAVGPPLGGFLGTIDPVPSLFWPALVSAGLSMIAFIGTVWWLPESLPANMRKPFGQKTESVDTEPRESFWVALQSRPIIAGLMAASLLVAVAGAAMQSVFQFWGRDLFDYSLRDVGFHFMAFALLSAVGQAGLVGPFAKRFGEKPVAVGSIVGITLGLLLFSFAMNDAMVWVAIAIFGLANGLFLPTISSLVSFESDPRSRGTMMGIFNASSSAGRILGPAISGPIYFKLGPAAPFLFCAAATILGAILLSRARARPIEEGAT